MQLQRILKASVDKPLRYAGWAIVVILVAGMIYWYYLDVQFQKGHAACQQVNRFAICLYGWVLTNDRLPGPTLADALRVLREDPANRYSDIDRVCRMIVANGDPWGRPFIYEVQEEKHRIQIRSMGPNGRDDRGEGDDILGDVNIPEGLSHPGVSDSQPNWFKRGG